MTIESWLESSTKKLNGAGISSAHIDALALMSYVLKISPEQIRAYPETNLDNYQITQLDDLINRRINDEPLAYLINLKEFYESDFYVDSNVLIPRPESEAIVDFALKAIDNLTNKKILIADIGTGSGCLGISIKLKRPDIDMSLCDVSPQALKVAQKNASRLKTKVNIILGNLLSPWLETNKKLGIIVAHLPYIDKSWMRSKETDYEPPISLFASDDGLELIKQLITQTKNGLKSNGYLILEADTRQLNSIIEFAKKYNLQPIDKTQFVLILQKIV